MHSETFDLWLTLVMFFLASLPIAEDIYLEYRSEKKEKYTVYEKKQKKVHEELKRKYKKQR